MRVRTRGLLPGGETFADAFCSRCDCCSADWQRCDDCDGEGYRDPNEDDPLAFEPGDVRPCSTCERAGGWFICLGGCDDEGVHG